MMPASCFRPIPGTIELINRKGLLWHYDSRDRVCYRKPSLHQGRYYFYNVRLTNGKNSFTLVNTIMRSAGFEPIEQLGPWYERVRRFVDRHQEILKLPKKSLAASQLPNGRSCHYCAQLLYGSYFWACPACWADLAIKYRDEKYHPDYIL